MSTFKHSTATMLEILEGDLRCSWAKEKAILEQRIEFLNDQIGEYIKREDDNKKMNSLMMDILKGLDSNSLREKEAHLRISNNELRQELDSVKEIHREILDHCEEQLRGLKEEAQQKDRQIETLEGRLKEEEERWREKYIRLEIEGRELQRKLEDQTLEETERRNSIVERQTLVVGLGTSYEETTRRDPVKMQQLKNVSSIQSRVNSISDVMKSSSDIQNDINEPNVRKNRVQGYMKKDKKELKMMMSTLLKVKGQLEEGHQNVTYIGERASMGRQSNKGSKSFYQ